MKYFSRTSSFILITFFPGELLSTTAPRGPTQQETRLPARNARLAQNVRILTAPVSSPVRVGNTPSQAPSPVLPARPAMHAPRPAIATRSSVSRGRTPSVKGPRVLCVPQGTSVPVQRPLRRWSAQPARSHWVIRLPVRHVPRATNAPPRM